MQRKGRENTELGDWISFLAALISNLLWEDEQMKDFSGAIICNMKSLTYLVFLNPFNYKDDCSLSHQSFFNNEMERRISL